MDDHTEEATSSRGFVPGDMLWTKVGKYPYWPCMVTYDPIEGCFSKEKTVRGKPHIIYHVQYFGEAAQHGWTQPGNTVRFQGQRHFFLYTNDLITDACRFGERFRRKMQDRYTVQKASKRAWLIAVLEAEKLLPIDAKERFGTLVFRYTKDKKKTAGCNGTLPQMKRNADRLQDKDEHMVVESKKKCLPDERCEDLCGICKESGVDMSCYGDCSQSFHMDCLGIIRVPKDFKCLECNLGCHTCFICSTTDDKSVKCSHPKCLRYYHKNCLDTYECYNKEKNICPLHTCQTCYKENPKNLMSRKGTLIRCIRCPTAFHSNESCIAAGSVELSPSTIICPYHFLGKNNTSKQPVCNVTYCSVCATGGVLVCCEACPNAYHPTCLINDVPAGDFYCDDCVKRKHVCYGMVVWAKTGNFRWWPAKILHPSQIPVNVKNIAHVDGEFPVWYFGTNEYAWSHRGRVIPYMEHHKDFSSSNSKSKRLKLQFKKSLAEAAEAYDEYQEVRVNESSLGEKPDAYKHIKVCRAVPPAQIVTVDKNSAFSCVCDPDSDHPCSTSDCLNRSVLMECHPEVCKASTCENQKFQKRQHVPVNVIKTKDRGFGLATLRNVKKGEFVIEYVGEIITRKEYNQRKEKMKEENATNYYFLYLDARRMIDAGPCGNLARFINHSCNPNCEMVKWSVNGDARIGIFALMDIPSGQEITFNYQAHDAYTFDQKCSCAASNCKGFIGRKNMPATDLLARVLPSPKAASAKPAKVKFKRKINRIPLEDRHENHCYVCKQPGSLVLCDVETCCRAYHVRCLAGLRDVPEGEWKCPLHCRECEKPSETSCGNCCSYYCEEHLFKLQKSPYFCINCVGKRIRIEI